MMNSGKHYDIAVIGAGIVGLAHAYIAAKNGRKVLLLERNHFALGASIRNFGLIWPIGQRRGVMLDRALRARAVWEEIAPKAGFWLNKNGSMHLAYHEDEWSVLEEFYDAGGTAYGSSLIAPDEVLEKSSMVKKEGLRGALHSKVDCTVDPSEAIRKIPEYLAGELGVDLAFGKTVTGLDGSTVYTFDDKYHADQIVICSGADFETLYPSLIQETSIQKCKLQMMRTHPVKEKIGPSLCAGLTLLHYDAFQSVTSLKKVADRYHQDSPHYQQHGIHVLVSQNDIGELILGDTHVHGKDHYPFNLVELDEYVIQYLHTFLNASNIKIKERWEGIYPKMTDGSSELVLNPEPNVWIVTGLGGAGMTLSFGLAQENYETHIS